MRKELTPKPIVDVRTHEQEILSKKNEHLKMHQRLHLQSLVIPQKVLNRAQNWTVVQLRRRHQTFRSVRTPNTRWELL